MLDAGRDPGNAPGLAGQAVTRLVDAVVTSEHGWRAGSASGDLGAIPDENPLKRPLHALRRSLPSVPPRRPLADGKAPAAPDLSLLREGILAARALLKDLAARFGTDLSGTLPAGSVAPIRPEPPAPPRAQPPIPPKRTAMPAPEEPARVARRPAPARRTAATGGLARAGAPPPADEPREVEGRSTIVPRSRSGPIASTAFWSLMDRWRIPDEAALDLIGHPGGLTKQGTRPRFRLTGEAADLFQGLLEIDAALGLLKLDPGAWLNGPIKAKPFAGATPLAFLTGTRMPGARSTIRFVLQNGLRMSLSA